MRSGVLVLVALLATESEAGAGPGTSRFVLYGCDVDGDGFADVAAVGGSAIRVSLMDGLAPRATAFVSSSLGAWTLADCGDVDADGRDELVFNGPAATRISSLTAGPPIGFTHAFLGNGGGAWPVVAIADLDGDGWEDLIQEGPAGLRLDRMRDGTSVATGYLGNGGGEYAFAAAGDFDGDGDADIAWNGTRVIRIDLLDGLTGVARGYLATDPEAFPVRVAADVDGDGRDDLVGDGIDATSITFLAGMASLGRRFVSTGAGAFRFTLVADLNGDGLADLANGEGTAPFAKLFLTRGDLSLRDPAGPLAVVGYLGKGGCQLRQSATLFGDGSADLLFDCGTTIRALQMDGLTAADQGFLPLGGTPGPLGVPPFLPLRRGR